VVLPFQKKMELKVDGIGNFTILFFLGGDVK